MPRKKQLETSPPSTLTNASAGLHIQ